MRIFKRKGEGFPSGMRIAFLSTMMGFYGGEVHLVELAAALRERGHEVLCLARQGSALLTRLQRRNLAVCELPFVQWYDPVNVARLGGVLRRQGVQVLHTHVPRDYYTAAAATLGSGIVNVGTRHQLQPISLPALKKPFLGRFEAMIAVSEAVRTELVANGALNPGRVITVPNGISASVPAGLDRCVDGPLRRACGAGLEDPVVGFVGRICPTKGLETLVAAAALLQGAWPRLKVCIIGEEDGHPGYRAGLARQVADLGLDGAVHFLGYRDDARQAAGEFDVQVLPSLAEPFGLVTLEAMAQGRPVVVTAAGGSPEIVRDGLEGFLVRPADPRQLASRLEVLLDSPGLRREMGRRGRRRVTEDFSLDLMVDRTEQVYRQALASSRRPAAART